MHKLLLALCFVLSSLGLSANTGDTTAIRTHNAVHMNWYGSYDKWAQFPGDTASFRKITLWYTLGCPSGGCSDWDYTTRVFVRHRTGMMDSTFMQSPFFTVNGNALDSVEFSFDTTYVHYYDSTTAGPDSMLAQLYTIVQYNDSLNPQVPTDTLWLWPASYWNYQFDSTGAIIDSMWVAVDSTFYQQMHSWYNVFEVIDDIEIARLITPYGNNLSSTWKRPYKLDVTDYWPILQDSVEVRVVYEGWSDGFTVTLDFEMIEGTPPREAYQVVNLWNGGFPYGDPNNSIENYLNPRTITVDTAAAAVRLRILQTGHGFGGNQNCAEFCPKSNYIKVNNTQVFSNLVWRDNCGENPLYPQPGTWLYDRANWCPGDIVWPYVHEMTPHMQAGQSYTIDMDMEPFTNVNNNSCSYGIGSHLVYFRQPSYSLDAELWDVLAPSDFPGYSRWNPICRNPQVVIRNAGSNILTSCIITYGVTGGPVQTYQWTGTLGFLDTAVVTLGAIDWFTPTYLHEFYATVSNPNGQADQHPDNNTMRSAYNVPASQTGDFIIQVKTNNYGYQTTYELLDEAGNVMLYRAGLGNNITYKDTMHLPQGCYQFRLYDGGKDGLSWWANTAAGSGTARFTNINPASPIKNFNSDFGSSIVYNFTVGYTVNTDEEAVAQANIYPNPAHDVLNIDLPGNDDGYVKIFDVSGRLVMTQQTEGQHNSMDVSMLAPGLYNVTVIVNGQQLSRRIVITR
jgi:hypothetical protein